MTPQPITINGLNGTVVYLNDRWQPVSPDEAILAKVLFEDGTISFFQAGSSRALANRETALHVAADRMAPKLVVAFRYAFARARQAIKPMLATSDVDEDTIAETAVQAIRKALRTFESSLSPIVSAGGEAGMKVVEQRLRNAELRSAKKKDVTLKIGPKPLKFDFDVTDKKAVNWARKHAAELISDVTETSRKRIKTAITKLIQGGDWNTALDVISKAVGDDDRAETIAHHEVMSAASAGQRLAWDQAVEEGWLTGDEQRAWIATPIGACPICENLDGTTAPLDGEYEGDIIGPPAHVGCRCTEGIV